MSFVLLLTGISQNEIEFPSIDGTSPVTGLASLGPPVNGGTHSISFPSIDGTSPVTGLARLYAVDSDGYRPW